MSRRRLQEDFGRSAPDGDQPRRSRRLPEILNVGPDMLGLIHLVLTFFDVVAIEGLDVIAVENRGLWLDGTEEGLDLVEQLVLEHPGLPSCRVHVILEKIPAGKNQIG